VKKKRRGARPRLPVKNQLAQLARNCADHPKCDFVTGFVVRLWRRKKKKCEGMNSLACRRWRAGVFTRFHQGRRAGARTQAGGVLPESSGWTRRLHENTCKIIGKAQGVCGPWDKKQEGPRRACKVSGAISKNSCDDEEAGDSLVQAALAWQVGRMFWRRSTLIELRKVKPALCYCAAHKRGDKMGGGERGKTFCLPRGLSRFYFPLSPSDEAKPGGDTTIVRCNSRRWAETIPGAPLADAEWTRVGENIFTGKQLDFLIASLMNTPDSSPSFPANDRGGGRRAGNLCAWRQWAMWQSGDRSPATRGAVSGGKSKGRGERFV